MFLKGVDFVQFSTSMNFQVAWNKTGAIFLSLYVVDWMTMAMAMLYNKIK